MNEQSREDEGFGGTYPDYRDLGRARRHWRVLTYLRDEQGSFDRVSDRDLASLQRRRSTNRITGLLGGTDRAQSTLRELVQAGMLEENEVPNQKGELGYRFYDVTDRGRIYQSELSRKLRGLGETMRRFI